MRTKTYSMLLKIHTGIIYGVEYLNYWKHFKMIRMVGKVVGK